jgi:hypothetical protein
MMAICIHGGGAAKLVGAAATVSGGRPCHHAVHIHDLPWKEHLPVARAPLDQTWVQLLKLGEGHAEGFRDLGGIVARLNGVLGHEQDD